jgi:F0F1-type ATP synthase membrane subunit b/b'
MTVTLNEMADAYILSIEKQLEQAKQQVSEAQTYVQQLEEHLNECKQVNQNSTGLKAEENVAPVINENPFVNQTTN